MTSFPNKRSPALLAASLLFALTGAHAGSSASSAASDSVSVSVGSLSGSVQQSSQSSGDDQKVADGDYRIIDIAAIAGEPARVRLLLQPVQAAAAAGPGFALVLPVELVQVQAGVLTEGATLGARNRPYGLEFSAGAPRRAFFLALHDDWRDELRSTPVTL